MNQSVVYEPKISDGINTVSTSAPNQIAGIGYVILSHDTTPEVYIAGCFKNNIITIVTQKGQIIKNCQVPKHCWADIDFPEDTKSRGSCVAWMNIPNYNKPVIMGVILRKDELNPIQQKNIFKLERRSQDNTVQTDVMISGDGTDGTLTLKVEGEHNQQGEMYFTCLNTDLLALMQMYCQGNINITSDKQIFLQAATKLLCTITDGNKSATINYILGTGYDLTDEFENKISTIDGKILIQTKSSGTITTMATGGDAVPALLGNQTKQLLSDMYSLLNSMVTTLQSAASGQYVLAAPVAAAALNWQQSLVNINEEFATILSQVVKLS